jgi:hypothetical protein
MMPISIHGDAALAGPGVVAETLQLSPPRGTGPAAPYTSSQRANARSANGEEADATAASPISRRSSASADVGE